MSALALPLLAGPAVSPPRPALPLPLPWIGQPDLFGAGVGGIGAYGPGGAGYGFGSPDYAPGYGLASIPELASGRPLPGSDLVREQADHEGYLGRPGRRPGSVTPEGPAWAAGGSPAVASSPDTAAPQPQDVPAPSSLSVLAGALAWVVIRRRNLRNAQRRA